LTHGAKCMIGDQLHPDGRIDPHVYALVGQVYQEIEQKGPWCIGAKPVTEIGVLTPEEFTGGEHGVLPEAIRGATRILEQGGHQFDILDSAGDFNKYRLLILPDHIPVSAELARKLKEYIEAGGSILASYASGMDEGQNGFSTNLFGVTLLNEGPRDSHGNLVRGRIYERHDYCEYLLPKGAIGHGLSATEHAMYRKGMAISASPSTETLAPLIGSWFDRTYRHFCSHRQTPSSGSVSQPGIVQNGRCIYFSNPIFSQYDDNAPHWCKVLVLNAIERLLPEPLVKHDGPSTLQVTVTQQPDHNRWVLHLLHFIPERRSKELDVIEDVIPLFNVNLFVLAPREILEAVLVPDGASLAFKKEGPYFIFQAPRIDGHGMVSLAFA
jgi:Beta-galactosidase trimerisation domain